MKRKKSLAALLTTAALMVGTATMAMAAEGGATEPTVDITKVYSLLNDGTSAPAETFSFTVEKEAVANSEWTLDDVPDLQWNGTPVGTVKIDYVANEAVTAPGVTKTENLSFPVDDNTRVGEYTYKITETKGSTAGVIYDNKVIHAKVTVLNNDEGVYVASVTYSVDGGKLGSGEGFENEYQAAKELTIEKEVKGNLGDKNKYFTVTVTLTGEEGKDTPPTFTVTGGKYGTTTITLNVPAEFEIKHGDTLHIENLPYGITYTVVEKDYTGTDGYNAAQYTLNGSSQGTTSVANELVDTASESVVITNEKGTDIDTGVSLDNLPYIILIAVVIVAAVFMFLRRRTVADRD